MAGISCAALAGLVTCGICSTFGLAFGNVNKVGFHEDGQLLKLMKLTKLEYLFIGFAVFASWRGSVSVNTICITEVLFDRFLWLSLVQ